MSLRNELHSSGRGGHMRRSPANCPTDPQHLIDTAPKGVWDWKPLLAAILRVHNHKHSALAKVVSHKTMLERRNFYFQFWQDVRRNTRFKTADPRYLKHRHVEAVTKLWAERKLAVATVHNYLSFLRTYASWIDRPGLVRDVATYFGEDSHYVDRERGAQEDRSWAAKGVDAEAKIAEVGAYDPWVGLQLELCYRFGMRAKESRHFRPHEAVVPRELAHPRDAEHFPDCERFVRLRHGTKGGRLRDVPVRTAEQRDLIERLLRTVAPGQYVGHPGRTWKQNMNRFYFVLARFGITRAALGVTAHGLRHQHANDRYEELAAEPSPVRGGAGAGEADRPARLAVAAELGHSRRAVTNAYLGASQAYKRAAQHQTAATAPTENADGSCAEPA
jgi:integrase